MEEERGEQEVRRRYIEKEREKRKWRKEEEQEVKKEEKEQGGRVSLPTLHRRMRR